MIVCSLNVLIQLQIDKEENILFPESIVSEGYSCLHKTGKEMEWFDHLEERVNVDSVVHSTYTVEASKPTQVRCLEKTKNVIF